MVNTSLDSRNEGAQTDLLEGRAPNEAGVLLGDDRTFNPQVPLRGNEGAVLGGASEYDGGMLVVEGKTTKAIAVSGIRLDGMDLYEAYLHCEV